MTICKFVPQVFKAILKPIEGGQTSTRPTERLFQSHGGAVWTGGQSLRRLRGED